MVGVGFVLGKPPQRSPVLGELVSQLRSDGEHVLVHVDDGTVPGWVADVDVVALRGVSTATLELLLVAEGAGIRFCDPPSSVLLTRDRARVASRLESVGIRVPRGTTASTWAEVRLLASTPTAHPVVVKARDGTVGRGARVLVAAEVRLPTLAPFPGPYRVEELVVGTVSETKLYRIGGHVAVFRQATGSTTWRQEPAGPWRGLALRATDALGLTVAGVDVLEGADGPVVVDVNAFPSGRRLPDAATRISGHLRSLAAEAPTTSRAVEGPGGAPPRILVVEDEERIAEFVARGLREQGFSVDVATDGRAGLDAALVEDVGLVILDLNLPLLPGEQVLRRLRSQRPHVPVIVLSAKDGIDDRVDNLYAGADDYLVKPFSFAELLARVQARFRDRTLSPEADLEHGRVRLDLRRRVACLDDRERELTARESALLETFLRHPGQTLSHAQLLAHAWGVDDQPSSNVIEVYIRHLRVKLAPDVIETIRATGYRFVG